MKKAVDHMISRLEPASIIMCKGMAVLLLVVTLGIAHVEREMNDLTRRQEFVQVLNIRRSPLAEYSAYILGASVSGQAGVAVGHIETDTHVLRLRLDGQAVAIPTTVSISAATAMKFWQTWSYQFRSEAERTYGALERSLAELEPTVEKLRKDSIQLSDRIVRKGWEWMEELAALIALLF